MHTDPEVLALVALGERDAATAEELDHIARCAICGHEVTELGHLSQVGRTISDHFTLETPSPEVWDRIRTQLGFADDFSSDLVPPARSAAPGGPVQPSTPVSPPVMAGPPPSEPSSPRPRHARRRLMSLALAAVLALLVGVAGTLAWQQFKPLTQTVLASTPLDALPNWSGTTGEAKLEQDALGRHVLVVTMVTPRPVDGIQQVWLIDRSADKMIPVGQLTAPVQSYTLSTNLDVSRFPVVDVSVEPSTGFTGHSGNSIVRGTLPI